MIYILLYRDVFAPVGLFDRDAYKESEIENRRNSKRKTDDEQPNNTFSTREKNTRKASSSS